MLLVQTVRYSQNALLLVVPMQLNVIYICLRTGNIVSLSASIMCNSDIH